MDTCTEQNALTDSLGRRTGPRRRLSVQEKRQIVEETRVKGASVATVARRYDLNANQVFAWRQLYRRGLLNEGAAQADPPLLPVKVSTPTVTPTERAVRQLPVKLQRARSASDAIEITLANGHGIAVHGRVDVRALGRVIELLVRR